MPASAIGKVGLCPGCGLEVQIREDNTRPYQPRRQRSGGLMAPAQAVQPNNAPREESSRRFAAAVDLYNARRYAEALVALDGLLLDFPGNPHIEAARDQCLDALNSAANPPPRTYASRPVAEDALSLDLLRSVLLDKLLHGGTEEVQLRAAELTLRLLRPEANAGPGNASNPGDAPPPDAALARIAALPWHRAARDAEPPSAQPRRDPMPRRARGEVIPLHHRPDEPAPARETSGRKPRKGGKKKAPGAPRKGKRRRGGA